MFTSSISDRRKPVLLVVSHFVRCMRRTSAILYMVALVPAALVLLLITIQSVIPVGHLLRDPMVVAVEIGLERPVWGGRVYGMVSNFGILAWSGAVGAALVGAAILHRSGRGRRYAAFLASGASLGTVLAIDDLFMIHESRYLSVIGGEPVLFGFYGVAILTYLALFRREILEETHGGLLLIALGFFGLSVGIDVVGTDALSMDSLYWVAEDGFKFLGITAWATFQFMAALDAGRIACHP
jgi:hypothetical protein